MGQSWTGIVAPARAIDWGKAGLPATFPNGETTPNPWTPPTRAACTSGQAGITVPVAAGTSFSSIVTAMHNCSVANPGGSYLLLGPGAFTIAANASFSSAPYVTLRGSGPMSTTLTMSGSTNLNVGGSGSFGGGTLNASPSQGATSVTVTGASGAVPVVGQLAGFNQCDTGWHGSAQPTMGYNSCTSGSYADNGYVFVCGGSTLCNVSGSGGAGGLQTSQTQYTTITSVTNNGGGSYTIGFKPGLYLTNWSTSNTAVLYWVSGAPGFGSALEDMTVLITGNSDVSLTSYATWIKGVRFIGSSGTLYDVRNGDGGSYAKNNLFANNYLFGGPPVTMDGNSFMVTTWNISDNLILNNIAEQGLFLEGHGSNTGTVIAYNFAQNVTANYVQSTDYQHDNSNSGVSYILNEGNQVNSIYDDDTWGTGDLNSFFRNWVTCSEVPYFYPAGITGNGIAIDGFHRFDNVVANVLAGGNQCTTYSSVSTDGSWFRIGKGASDPLTAQSLMRWANYDAANAAVRCQSSEVPTSLSGAAAPFVNSLPSTPAVCGGSGVVPASFFMNSATAHPSGGTGLSWWKTCTNWTTFPTSCASSVTSPFPSSGPDVSGGSLASGHAYPSPTRLAWQTLPIDTSFQNSYSITGSSWSGGIETLTVSGLPANQNDIIGPFQISGGACATSGAGTPTGAEVVMTGSTTTTIKYALASSPGTCTGTMLWPDIRQFDERVYQTDTGGTTFALSTGITGTGSGTVTGTNCPSGTYASGTLVGACTATPSAGSTFTGWTGTGSAGGCTGTGTCGPFTLSANSTINAAFSLTAHTLSTATAGTGSGTITGCAGNYAFGDPYTCLANPAAGSTVSWSSTCGGTPSGLTYSGAMPNSACTVTATFQATVATPAFSPVAGSYSTPQRVAISTTTPGTVIHYTVDGSTPTTSSPVYTHKLYLAQSQTLKALAAATGYTNSAVGSSAYVVSKAKTRFSLTPTSSSSIPVPYPPDLRACCGSNVAALETARGTYNLTSFHNWISAALAHGSTFTYTIQGFPAWMNGLGGVESAPPTDLHVTAACQNVLTGTTTTDCSMKEFVTKLMMDRTGLSSQPANPVTCANLDYLEIINEFNTDDTGGSTGWTGTYADLAVLGNDISERAHLWCSNTVVVAGSASAIVGFHTNGENAHYDVALETLLADWTGIANASLPDAISFHAYPSRNNIVEMPMPTTIVSHSSATCTSGNTPNTSCYKAVKDEVNQLNTSATLQNAAVIAWAKFLPIYSTEGGFGTVAQLGGTSTTTIGAAYVAQSMMAIAAQNPVNHMFYAADDPTWGCYWNCGSGTSAWLFAYNQMLSWLNANAITGTLTSSAITGGNKWTLQLNSGAAEIDFCDAWLASCTASTSFNSVQTLSGVTTSTGGSVTLTQEPSLLFNAGIVATPTFSPVAGSYGSTQNVTISDSTAGATICYTTDGSTPTSSPVGTCSHGTTYSAPVSVSSSLTLKAIGTQAGNADSGVGSAAYVIAAATPTFSPVAGSYGASQSVTISDSTPSSTIYYTTDGSTPTTGSTVYSTPITVSSTTTVKAIGAASGFGNSAVGSALYTINGAAATPTFLPVAGTYSATQAVVISSSTAGATICWTSDGSTPTANGSGTCTHGTTYAGAVTVASSLTLKAVASKATFVDSSAGSAAYVITAPSPVTVTLTGTQKFSGTGSIQ